MITYAVNWLSQRLNARRQPSGNVTSALHNPPHSSDSPRGTKMPVFSLNNGEFKTARPLALRESQSFVVLKLNLSKGPNTRSYLCSARRESQARPLMFSTLEVDSFINKSCASYVYTVH